MRRAGLLLVLGGVMVLGFVVLTDPYVSPKMMNQLGWGTNLVDAVHDAWMGTAIGLAGSAVIVSIGLWLVLRRSI